MAQSRIVGRLAPAVGLEPTTKRLTAARSTTELRRNDGPPGLGLAETACVSGAGSAPRDRIARSRNGTGSPNLKPGVIHPR